jgi:hypothetical protein
MSETKPPPRVDPAAQALLRHALATLAYRSAKTLRGAPEGFGDFRAFEGARTPVEILAHMGDLLDWGLSVADGEPKWTSSKPLAWEQECDRYFATLKALDQRLAAREPIQRRPERIFQAPIADALTHTGQLALLRRLYGSPIRGENYYVAPITAGRVGPDQGDPGMEL